MHGLRNSFVKVRVRRATCVACSGNLEVSGTIPAFALVHGEIKKNLCQDGRSQDLPDTDFKPAFRLLSKKDNNEVFRLQVDSRA